MALDYLKDLEAASGQRAGDPELDQRRRDAAAGRYGMFAEASDPMALVIGWQVPASGVPIGPPPAFLGPRWVAGPAPGLDGAIVLDRQTNKTSILPPASWLVRYEDGGEVAGYDDVTFRESYTYLGEVGSGIRRQRAEEPVDPEAAPPPRRPAPPPRPMPAQAIPPPSDARAAYEEAWKAGYEHRTLQQQRPVEIQWYMAMVTEDNARLRRENAQLQAQVGQLMDARSRLMADYEALREQMISEGHLSSTPAGPTPGVEQTGGLGSHDSQGPTSTDSATTEPDSVVDTPPGPSDTDVSSTKADADG